MNKTAASLSSRTNTLHENSVPAPNAYTKEKGLTQLSHTIAPRVGGAPVLSGPGPAAYSLKNTDSAPAVSMSSRYRTSLDRSADVVPGVGAY